MERERGVKDILSNRRGREERRRTPGNALDAREEGKMRDNLSVHWENGGRNGKEEGGLLRLGRCAGCQRGHGWGERSRRR